MRENSVVYLSPALSDLEERVVSLNDRLFEEEKLFALLRPKTSVTG